MRVFSFAYFMSGDYPYNGPDWIDHGGLRDSRRRLLSRASRKFYTLHD